MRHILAALGLSCLIAMPAHAGVDAHASMSGLRFELVDLDPNDGVSPSMTWVNGWANGSIYLVTRDMTEGRSINFSDPFREVSRSLTTGPASGEFDFQGLDVGTFATSARIHTSLEVVEPATFPQQYSRTDWYLNIKLSPHTQLKVTAVSRFEANSDQTIASEHFSDTSGLTRLSLALDADQFFYSYVGTSGPVSFSKVAEETLSVSFTNDWTTDQTQSLHVGTWLSHSVTQVPEPSPSGLFVAGFLLLGMLTRLRRAG